MKYPSKIDVLFSFSVFFFISGCGPHSGPSPYDALLKQPPFHELTDSIRSDPQNAALYFRRAVLLNRHHHPEPALADFRKAWSLQKEEQYALGIANVLAEKRPDSAIHFSRLALKELPQSILLRLSLAKALELLNKPEDALQVCDDILGMNPQQLDALLLKASLLEKSQRTNEAIAALEAARAVAPHLHDVNYQLAFLYAQSGNAKTLTLCDSLIKKDSLGRTPEPYYFKGIYFYSTGHKPKAIAWFNRAIRADYNFLDAHLDKGKTLYEMKNYTEAFTTLQRAASITPTFADAWYWMARCQEAMGEKEEARLNYLRAYGLDKTLTEAKEAADKLK
jgi:tetratricopeptide (TPR) repeat protein